MVEDPDYSSRFFFFFFKFAYVKQHNVSNNLLPLKNIITLYNDTVLCLTLMAILSYISFIIQFP